MARVRAALDVPMKPGRPRSTSHADLESVAFELFAERGFDQVSVDDITAAAGIGRRTFFRYYASKNDVVWGEFTRELDRMRDWFAGASTELPLMEAVRQAVVEFNRVPEQHVARHRERMSLILGVPTLLAHSTLRFVQWRDVIAEFSARRMGCSPADLIPVAIGQCALGSALAAYEIWLRDEGSDLLALLDRAVFELSTGFAGSAP
ncbi:mycofactocin system transcriptional regulator [Jatrophihabitans sp. DSM 45814]